MTMHNPMSRTLLALLALTLALGGCVYKQDIRQGNPVDAEALEQVQPGQTTRAQVRFLLGTPIVADPFHNDRWDYVYYFEDGKTGRTVQRRYEVYFDGDVVARVVEADG